MKAPAVFDHFQGVGVHGIGVEQVVLHLAHDAPEFGQVVAQNAVARHAPQLSVILLGAQDVQESSLVDLVGPEGIVYQVAVVADQADGGGAIRLRFLVVGAQQEYFQQGAGVVLNTSSLRASI